MATHFLQSFFFSFRFLFQSNQADYHQKRKPLFSGLVRPDAKVRNTNILNSACTGRWVANNQKHHVMPRAPLAGPDPALNTERKCVSIGTYPSSILQLGRWQYASLHLRHVICDVDPKCLKVGIGVEIRFTNLSDEFSQQHQSFSKVILIIKLYINKVHGGKSQSDQEISSLENLSQNFQWFSKKKKDQAFIKRGNRWNFLEMNRSDWSTFLVSERK